MKLKKKIKSGVLKHDILREFEISKSTYYRFIVREHVLLLKNLPKLKFSLIIFYVLTVFILFWLKKKLMKIILTCDTRYGPVCLLLPIWLLNDLVRFLGHSTEQSQQLALQCIISVNIYKVWDKSRGYQTTLTLPHKV